MQLLYRVLLILVLPLVFIGGINLEIDPDYTLKKDYIPPLAQALVNGNLVSGPVNTNSRLLKKDWIRQLPYLPDVLVLGSSRTQPLKKESFPDKMFFNASVSNCTFQDMYAFINLLEEKDRELPETIIICADQWLLGNSFSEKRWLFNRDQFVKLYGNIAPNIDYTVPLKWELQKEWIKELFSVRYLIRALRTFGKTEPFVIEHQIDSSKTMLLPDGSRSLPQKLITASPTEINQLAKDYFYQSKDEQFTEVSKIQKQLFIDFIRYLQEKSCEVILFLPPYHPETFRLISQSEKHTGVLKAETFFQQFAQQNNIPILGGTNPAAMNLKADDFYDAVHLKPNTLNCLFKQRD